VAGHVTARLAFDVVVAGAGPAGVASAIVARQAGLRVGLVDGVDDDALKVGESLPGGIVRLLRPLGVSGPGELLGPDELTPCVANVSAWGSDAWSFNDALASPEGGGWHVLRHRFDAALRQHAASLGAERLRAGVADVERVADRYRVGLRANLDGRLSAPETSVEARFVIDATGRRAAIARILGAKRRRLSDQCAVVAWLRHPPHDLDGTTRVKAVRNGWWYTARLPQLLRIVAFHGLATDVAQMIKHPQRFAEECDAAGVLPYPVATDGFVRPLKAVDASMQVAEPAVGPGWLAVGDAALSFDPLSSQGVLFALYSGMRGAEAAIHCLGRPARADESLDEYQRKVRGVLRANQRERMAFYWSERRYPESPYWRVQRQRLAAAPPEHADMIGSRPTSRP
jgi:flavin-dependent dehydrogenase